MCEHSNDEIREQLLVTHATLRQEMSEIGQLLRKGDLAHSRAKVLRLLRTLHAGLMREDAELPGRLLDADAWGATRADRQHRANTLLRVEVARLFDGLHAETIDDPAAIEAFLAAASAELSKVEREVLSKDVLRDDIVVTDFGGG